MALLQLFTSVSWRAHRNAATAIFSLVFAPAFAQVPQEKPALPAASSASTVVPPSAIRVKPAWRSGERPDTLPEVEALAKKGRYGVVSVKGIVNAEGRVVEAAMDPSTGDSAVDAAILRAINGWTLSPPIDRSGAKVSTTARFPITIGRYPDRIAGAPPIMPVAAKDAFHNGQVRVTYKIDASGLPTEIKLAESSRSDLLDQAALTAVAGFRFKKPFGLDGQPTMLPAALTQNFSQMDGEGSYIGSLKSLPCRLVTGEVDWWIQANPDRKVEKMEFYTFMAGVSFVAPEALGWGKLSPLDAVKRHPVAWEKAIEACRAKPDSSFLNEYRRG